MTHMFLGHKGVLPPGYSLVMNEFALHVCGNPITNGFCAAMIFMLCGPDVHGLNMVSEKTSLPQEVLF